MAWTKDAFRRLRFTNIRIAGTISVRMSNSRSSWAWRSNTKTQFYMRNKAILMMPMPMMVMVTLLCRCQMRTILSCSGLSNTVSNNGMMPPNSVTYTRTRTTPKQRVNNSQVTYQWTCCVSMLRTFIVCMSDDCSVSIGFCGSTGLDKHSRNFTTATLTWI